MFSTIRQHFTCNSGDTFKSLAFTYVTEGEVPQGITQVEFAALVARQKLILWDPTGYALTCRIVDQVTRAELFTPTVLTDPLVSGVYFELTEAETTTLDDTVCLYEIKASKSGHTFRVAKGTLTVRDSLDDDGGV